MTLSKFVTDIDMRPIAEDFANRSLENASGVVEERSADTFGGGRVLDQSPLIIAARLSLPDRLLRHCSPLSFCYLLYVGFDGLRIVPAVILRNDAVRLRWAPGVRIVLMDRRRVS
jgi:hypothetical protein